MSVLRTIIIFSAALACWSLAGWIRSCGHSLQNAGGSAITPLGVCGSPYGGLVARLVKRSLNSYWHNGEKEYPRSDSPVLSSRFRMRDPLKPLEQVNHVSLIERWGSNLSALEFRRFRRTTAAELSVGHKRYLNAAGRLRLKLAFRLDPGDPALYEILHQSLIENSNNAESTHQAARALAVQTVNQALSFQGSPSAALTGAGSMLNLLSGNSPPDVLEADWKLHLSCLERYHSTIRVGRLEGWWDNIPMSRRIEIHSYADLVDRLSMKARQFLQNRNNNP